MKALAIALAVIFFAVAACYWFGVGWTFHPKRALAFALLGVLSLAWMRFQKTGSGVAPTA
jgi:hypothetical protein